METLTQDRPKLGVLGTGTMGSALGSLWARRGYPVVFGSRSPERASAVAASAGPTASGGTYRDAAAHGDVLILPTLWEHTEEVIRQAGSLEGKVLLDCSNPEGSDGHTLMVGHTDSGAENVARWAAGARVVKAFNHVYAEIVNTDPVFGAESASVLYCGDDPDAKAIVARMGMECGFDMIDAGPLVNARLLEPAAALMVQLVRVMGLGPGNVALKLLRR
jgi:predicted dinucleotide-binding enzyme